MNRSTKLLLDILIGAVVPIVILSYLSGPLGAPAAYLVAALVPVAWVFADLLLITRRFNAITSYVGLSAIVRGALAFWFVDGWLFALKDSAGQAVAALVFAGSVLAGWPIMRAFLAQTLSPDTPERARALASLLAEPPLARALVASTLLVGAWNVLSGVINFLLNLRIVTAPFGTELFNQQVAQVNAITRIALLLPDFAAVALAFWLLFRALYRALPSEEGAPQLESDIWDLVRLREADAAEGSTKDTKNATREGNSAAPTEVA